MSGISKTVNQKRTDYRGCEQLRFILEGVEDQSDD